MDRVILLKTMKFIYLLSSIVVALSLTSCLQNETTIHLNKDGSGTLVEETTFGAQAVAMFSQMAAMGGGQPGGDPIAEMFSAAKAKERAAKMGEGVTLEKAEPLVRGANKGGRVTYHFTDINKLKITPGEGIKDTLPTAPGQEAAPQKDNHVQFKYADGKLTLVMSDPKKAETPKAPKPEQPEMSPQEQAMMKQMMGDMTMKFFIVADGGIKSSNATYRDGNKVTLIDMEMGKLMENPETMKKLRALGEDDSEKAMEVMKGIEGVKVETQKEVTIELE